MFLLEEKEPARRRQTTAARVQQGSEERKVWVRRLAGKAGAMEGNAREAQKGDTGGWTGDTTQG